MAQLVTIWKGEDFALSFECRDADGELIDFGVDAQVWSHVRKVAGGPMVADLMPWFDFENQGVIRISLPGDQTNAWPAGDFQWDMVAKLATGAYVAIVPTSPICIRQRMTHVPHPI